MPYQKSYPQLTPQLADIVGTELIALSGPNLGDILGTVSLNTLAAWLSTGGGGGTVYANQLMAQILPADWETSGAGDFADLFDDWLATLGGNGGDAYIPAGNFHFSRTLVFNQSYVRLFMAPGAALIPDFDSSASNWIQFGEAGSVTIVEGSGIFGGVISAGVTTTGGYAFDWQKSSRCFLQNVKVEGAYDGVKYGSTNFVSSSEYAATGRLINCNFGTAHDGIVFGGGGAGLLVSISQFQGVPGNSGVGVRYVGPGDGFFADSLCNFEEYDVMVKTEHTAGNVANIYDYSSKSFPRNQFFLFALSGSAGIGNFNSYNNTCTDGAVGSDTVFLETTGTTSGSLNARFSGTRVADLKRNVLVLTDAFDRLVLNDFSVTGGGADGSNTYDALDFGAAAHANVQISGTFGGAWRYGMARASAIVECDIQAGFPGAVTGAVNTSNCGLRSALRQFDISGIPAPASYTLGPYQVVNLPASTATNATLAVGIDQVPIPRAARVSAIFTRGSAARVAGTVTFKPLVNGNPGTLTATINGTNTTNAYATQNSGDALSVGATLGIRVTSDGSWAPTTGDFSAFVEVVETGFGV